MAVTRRRRRNPFVIAVAIGIAVIFVAGSATGLYLTFSGGSSPEELLEKGQEQFQAGEYAKAVDSYKAAIEKEPDSQQAYNLLGMAYRFLANQTGSAVYRGKEVSAFRKAVELEPGNYVSLVNLGTTLYYQGDKKSAAGYLQKALQVNPNSEEKAQIEQIISEGRQPAAVPP